MEKRVIKLKPYIISSIISLIIGGATFVIYCLLKDFHIAAIGDGLTFAAAVLLAIGGLRWVNRNGLFDSLSYGFKQVGSMLFSKKPSEYNDYMGYKSAMNVNREKAPKTYLSNLIVGVLFLLASIVAIIIRSNMTF